MSKQGDGGQEKPKHIVLTEDQKIAAEEGVKALAEELRLDVNAFPIFSAEGPVVKSESAIKALATGGNASITAASSMDVTKPKKADSKVKKSQSESNIDPEKSARKGLLEKMGGEEIARSVLYQAFNDFAQDPSDAHRAALGDAMQSHASAKNALKVEQENMAEVLIESYKKPLKKALKSALGSTLKDDQSLELAAAGIARHIADHKTDDPTIDPFSKKTRDKLVKEYVDRAKTGLKSEQAYHYEKSHQGQDLDEPVHSTLRERGRMDRFKDFVTGEDKERTYHDRDKEEVRVSFGDKDGRVIDVVEHEGIDPEEIKKKRAEHTQLKDQLSEIESGIQNLTQQKSEAEQDQDQEEIDNIEKLLAKEEAKRDGLKPRYDVLNAEIESFDRKIEEIKQADQAIEVERKADVQKAKDSPGTKKELGTVFHSYDQDQAIADPETPQKEPKEVAPTVLRRKDERDLFVKETLTRRDLLPVYDVVGNAIGAVRDDEAVANVDAAVVAMGMSDAEKKTVRGQRMGKGPKSMEFEKVEGSVNLEEIEAQFNKLMPDAEKPLVGEALRAESRKYMGMVNKYFDDVLGGKDIFTDPTEEKLHKVEEAMASINAMNAKFSSTVLVKERDAEGNIIQEEVDGKLVDKIAKTLDGKRKKDLDRADINNNLIGKGSGVIAQRYKISRGELEEAREVLDIKNLEKRGNEIGVSDLTVKEETILKWISEDPKGPKKDYITRFIQENSNPEFQKKLEEHKQGLINAGVQADIVDHVVQLVQVSEQDIALLEKASVVIHKAEKGEKIKDKERLLEEEVAALTGPKTAALDRMKDFIPRDRAEAARAASTIKSEHWGKHLQEMHDQQLVDQGLQNPSHASGLTHGEYQALAWMTDKAEGRPISPAAQQYVKNFLEYAVGNKDTVQRLEAFRDRAEIYGISPDFVDDVMLLNQASRLEKSMKKPEKMLLEDTKNLQHTRAALRELQQAGFVKEGGKISKLSSKVEKATEEVQRLQKEDQFISAPVRQGPELRAFDFQEMDNRLISADDMEVMHLTEALKSKFPELSPSDLAAAAGVIHELEKPNKGDRDMNAYSARVLEGISENRSTNLTAADVIKTVLPDKTNQLSDAINSVAQASSGEKQEELKGRIEVIESNVLLLSKDKAKMKRENNQERINEITNDIKELNVKLTSLKEELKKSMGVDPELLTTITSFGKAPENIDQLLDSMVAYHRPDDMREFEQAKQNMLANEDAKVLPTRGEVQFDDHYRAKVDESGKRSREQKGNKEKRQHYQTFMETEGIVDGEVVQDRTAKPREGRKPLQFDEEAIQRKAPKHSLRGVGPVSEEDMDADFQQLMEDGSLSAAERYADTTQRLIQQELDRFNPRESKEEYNARDDRIDTIERKFKQQKGEFGKTAKWKGDDKKTHYASARMDAGDYLASKTVSDAMGSLKDTLLVQNPENREKIQAKNLSYEAAVKEVIQKRYPSIDPAEAQKAAEFMIHKNPPTIDPRNLASVTEEEVRRYTNQLSQSVTASRKDKRRGVEAATEPLPLMEEEVAITAHEVVNNMGVEATEQEITQHANQKVVQAALASEGHQRFTPEQEMQALRGKLKADDQARTVQHQPSEAMKRTGLFHEDGSPIGKDAAMDLAGDLQADIDALKAHEAHFRQYEGASQIASEYNVKDNLELIRAECAFKEAQHALVVTYSEKGGIDPKALDAFKASEETYQVADNRVKLARDDEYQTCIKNDLEYQGVDSGVAEVMARTIVQEAVSGQSLQDYPFVSGQGAALLNSMHPKVKGYKVLAKSVAEKAKENGFNEGEKLSPNDAMPKAVEVTQSVLQESGIELGDGLSTIMQNVTNGLEVAENSLYGGITQEQKNGLQAAWGEPVIENQAVQQTRMPASDSVDFGSFDELNNIEADMNQELSILDHIPPQQLSPEEKVFNMAQEIGIDLANYGVLDDEGKLKPEGELQEMAAKVDKEYQGYKKARRDNKRDEFEPKRNIVKGVADMVAPRGVPLQKESMQKEGEEMLRAGMERVSQSQQAAMELVQSTPTAQEKPKEVNVHPLEKVGLHRGGTYVGDAAVREQRAKLSTDIARIQEAQQADNLSQNNRAFLDAERAMKEAQDRMLEASLTSSSKEVDITTLNEFNAKDKAYQEAMSNADPAFIEGHQAKEQEATKLQQGREAFDRSHEVSGRDRAETTRPKEEPVRSRSDTEALSLNREQRDALSAEAEQRKAVLSDQKSSVGELGNDLENDFGDLPKPDASKVIPVDKTIETGLMDLMADLEKFEKGQSTDQKSPSDSQQSPHTQVEDELEKIKEASKRTTIEHGVQEYKPMQATISHVPGKEQSDVSESLDFDQELAAILGVLDHVDSALDSFSAAAEKISLDNQGYEASINHQPKLREPEFSKEFAGKVKDTITMEMLNGLPDQGKDKLQKGFQAAGYDVSNDEKLLSVVQDNVAAGIGKRSMLSEASGSKMLDSAVLQENVQQMVTQLANSNAMQQASQGRDTFFEKRTKLQEDIEKASEKSKKEIHAVLQDGVKTVASSCAENIVAQQQKADIAQHVMDGIETKVKVKTEDRELLMEVLESRAGSLTPKDKLAVLKADITDAQLEAFNSSYREHSTQYTIASKNAQNEITTKKKEVEAGKEGAQAELEQAEKKLEEVQKTRVDAMNKAVATLYSDMKPKEVTIEKEKPRKMGVTKVVKKVKEKIPGTSKKEKEEPKKSEPSPSVSVDTDALIQKVNETVDKKIDQLDMSQFIQKCADNEITMTEFQARKLLKEHVKAPLETQLRKMDPESQQAMLESKTLEKVVGNQLEKADKLLEQQIHNKSKLIEKKRGDSQKENEALGNEYRQHEEKGGVAFRNQAEKGIEEEITRQSAAFIKEQKVSHIVDRVMKEVGDAVDPETKEAISKELHTRFHKVSDRYCDAMIAAEKINVDGLTSVGGIDDFMKTHKPEIEKVTKKTLMSDIDTLNQGFLKETYGKDIGNESSTRKPRIITGIKDATTLKQVGQAYFDVTLSDGEIMRNVPAQTMLKWKDAAAMEDDERGHYTEIITHITQDMEHKQHEQERKKVVESFPPEKEQQSFQRQDTPVHVAVSKPEKPQEKLGDLIDKANLHIPDSLVFQYAKAQGVGFGEKQFAVSLDDAEKTQLETLRSEIATELRRGLKEDLGQENLERPVGKEFEADALLSYGAGKLEDTLKNVTDTDPQKIQDGLKAANSEMLQECERSVPGYQAHAVSKEREQAAAMIEETVSVENKEKVPSVETKKRKNRKAPEVEKSTLEKAEEPKQSIADVIDAAIEQLKGEQAQTFIEEHKQPRMTVPNLQTKRQLDGDKYNLVIDTIGEQLKEQFKIQKKDASAHEMDPGFVQKMVVAVACSTLNSMNANTLEGKFETKEKVKTQLDPVMQGAVEMIKGKSEEIKPIEVKEDVAKEKKGGIVRQATQRVFGKGSKTPKASSDTLKEAGVEPSRKVNTPQDDFSPPSESKLNQALEDVKKQAEEREKQFESSTKDKTANLQQNPQQEAAPEPRKTGMFSGIKNAIAKLFSHEKTTAQESSQDSQPVESKKTSDPKGGGPFDVDPTKQITPDQGSSKTPSNQTRKLL